MNLIYLQLNDYDKAHCHFPYHFNGWFSDGWTVYPIFQPLKGEIVYEVEYQGDISKTDKECAKKLGVKSVPNNVVCYFE